MTIFRPGLRRAVFARVMLCTLATLFAGCERSSRREAAKPRTGKYNVVLITIDTLRADHLGCYGYFRDTSPNMDALAHESVLFENAYAPMATTLPSHTSIMTGTHPLEHGILANVGDGGRPFRPTERLKTFAQFASTGGYKTAAFVSAAPLASDGGLNVGFDVYNEPSAEMRRAPATTSAALKWLDGVGDERFFLFVHFFDPHTPYRPPPPYDSLFSDDPQLEQFLADREIPQRVEPDLCKGRHPTITRSATNLYDGEIRYTDEHIKKLLDRLAALGLTDKTIIVLTADHGEGLGQHNWPQHGRVWNEQLHVPLMIRFPGAENIKPRRIPLLVSLLDVMPTVVAHLSADWAPAFAEQASGRNVLVANFEPSPVLSHRSARDCGDNSGPRDALTTPGWRFLAYPRHGHLLFDLTTDPYELQNTFVPDSEAATRWIETRKRIVRAYKTRGVRLREGMSTEAVALSRQRIQQLQSIGYTGDATDVVEPNVPAESDDEKP